MQRITIATHFRGEAVPPTGQPPQTDPRATSIAVEALNADGSPAGIASVAYENHVVFTSESTFTETGTIRFDDGESSLQIATVDAGTLGPSGDPDALHGAVMYSITGATGRFAGATGLVTSNFVLWPARGEFDDRQIAVLFLP